MKAQRKIEDALGEVKKEIVESDKEKSILLAKQAVLLGDAIDLAYGVDPMTKRATTYLTKKNKKDTK